APAINKLRHGLMAEHVDPLPKGGHILEVGCGGGQLALELAELRSDLTIVGLDLSPLMVARAERRTRHLRDRVRFVEGTALELAFGAAEFDAVFSIGSIKHWPDQAAGLRECVRVLKPGGRLVVAELDRSCHLEDARKFVSNWRMPRAFRPVVLPLFRTFVVG